jgi:hypothetical protein
MGWHSTLRLFVLVMSPILFWFSYKTGSTRGQILSLFAVACVLAFKKSAGAKIVPGGQKSAGRKQTEARETGKEEKAVSKK